MQSIARMTGGQAFYLTNGIAAAMTRAVDDTAIVYTIGFSPSSEEQDSGFHTLRVEVDRDDVTVRHRRGYYGFGSPELRTTDSEVPIEDLVRSPINATSIGIVAIRERLPEGGTSTRMAVSLDDLDLEFVDDRWKGQLEVATLLVEPGDSASGIDVGELTIDLTDEQFLLTFDIGGYPLFRLRNDGAFLRIVVREPSSGAAGSMWVELR
jgi:hypothetical protein